MSMPGRKSRLVASLALAVVAFATTACTTTSSRTQTAAGLDAILAMPHRSAENRARDVYRHPKETLLFFGLRPEMTVLEASPGAGWYTQVIAPLVRERGRYLAGLAPLDPANQNSVRNHSAFRAMLDAAPGVLDKVEIVPFSPGRAAITAEGSVDLAVAFRELHGWMEGDLAPAALADIYRVLKPGGVFGLVGHRGNPALPQDPRAPTGYVNQAYAIRLIETAGFRLVATSEINANPKDTRDYPRGVWTLPPNLAEGDNDRARYLTIGESDRFTLKFVRPR
jgi:predicted methyltransferase